MYDDHTVGVVIPAYNEAGFVGDVIETIPDYVDRIYPVDDCSTDGTWTEIREVAARIDGADSAVSADGGTAPSGTSANGAAATDASTNATTTSGASTSGTDSGATGAAAVDGAPRVDRIDDAGAATDVDEIPAADASADAGFSRRVVPIRHAENRGVGGAIKTGYQRARVDEIDVTVVMGGDGQMDPGWMPDLLDPIVDGRAEYAKANRLLLPEHHDTMPGHRFVGNHILTGLTKIATGYWSVGDPQHGYTAISLEALETAGIDEMYEFFGYCNDLLIRLSAENLRVADVPCPLTYADEESHIAYREYIPRVSGMLLRSFLRRLWVDRSSAGGYGRLALFVGGAIATVGGILGMVVSGIRSRRARGSRYLGEGAPISLEELQEDDLDSIGDAVTSTGTTDDEAVESDESASPEADEEDSASSDPDDVSTDEEPTVDAGATSVSTDGGVQHAASGESRTEPATDGGSSDGSRYALFAVAGVAALLGAMLLDAVMNATNNYTERVPEDAGPRVGEEAAGAPAERQE